MRSILVAAGGSGSDAPVFETALAAAKPLAAHLDFFHLRPRLGEAAVNTPHADMAIGPGLTSTLDRLETEITRRSRAGERHFNEFCARHSLEVVDRPIAAQRVTARWQEVVGDSLECLTFAARHHDLLVMGRPSGPNGLPADLADLLLLRSGCPILLAPASGRHSVTGTVLVCWKDTPEAAHALAASLPLLKKAERVAIIGIQDDDRVSVDSLKAGLQAAAHRLAWHGIDAETKFIPAEGRLASEIISATAQAHGANLVVMGAYGHGRMRQVIFGGCTQHFLRDDSFAVLLAH